MQISKLAKQNWFIPAVLTVGIGLAIVLSNRPPEGPNGGVLINNPGHYNEVAKEAETLVQTPFYQADAGQELTQEDRDKLRKAIVLFDSMNAFQPEKLGPYLGAGKAHALLGEYEEAEQALKQVLLNMPKYENNDRGKLAVVEALYMLSIVSFEQKNYEDAFKHADLAVEAVPDVPNYRVARANVEVQLKMIPEAKADVDAALALDPEHPKAKMLKMLLKKAK